MEYLALAACRRESLPTGVAPFLYSLGLSDQAALEYERSY